jgi:hypothetical protein
LSERSAARAARPLRREEGGEGASLLWAGWEPFASLRAGSALPGWEERAGWEPFASLRAGSALPGWEERAGWEPALVGGGECMGRGS